ncbi:MAG: NUDIX domain-containing protein [Candidatus Omnitrophica bacterium]|nr:NUDIX domain-containing protein [Candidatus Omnitrophota bacterium]
MRELRDEEVIGETIELDGKYQERKAARAVVFDNKGKIAVMYSRNVLFHKLPGGGIEKGEDILLALEREVEEEVGVDIEVGNEIGEIIEYRNDYGLKHISYCYFAKVIGDLREQQLTEYESKELDFELKWVSLDEAIRLLEKDCPEDYTGKFIVARDLIFLREAGEIFGARDNECSDFVGNK